MALLPRLTKNTQSLQKTGSNALRMTILGCLLANSAWAEPVSLPANTFTQPLGFAVSAESAADSITGKTGRLLQDASLSIDNTKAVEPVHIAVQEPVSLANKNTPSLKPEPATDEAVFVAKPEFDTKPQQASPDSLPGSATQLLSKAAEDTQINNRNTPITASLSVDESLQNAPEAEQAVKAIIKQPDSAKPSDTKDTADKAIHERYLALDEPYKLHPDVESICNKIGNKLGSVSVKECLDLEFLPPRFYSAKGRLILEKHFPADESLDSPAKILFIGGIHGDEYSSISVTFKWLNTLAANHTGTYDWHFLPLANPDGLLRKKATRVNSNDVDLNRNFIPAESGVNPLQHWQTYAKKRARYYPGSKPLSEKESRAIHVLIDELKPDVIVSVHAPHGILDFDGSIKPPRKLGPLYLKQLGTYPGSLGNYGWFVKGIPVMTIELEHAGIMPKKAEISRMWTDLIAWIEQRTSGDNSLLARRNQEQ